MYVIFILSFMLRDLCLQIKSEQKRKIVFFFLFSVFRTVLIICPDAQWHLFDATDSQKRFYFFHF